MIISHIACNHYISKLSNWIEIKLNSGFRSGLHEPSELIPNDSAFRCSSKFKCIYSDNLSHLIAVHHILVLLLKERIIELFFYLRPYLWHLNLILIENIHDHRMISELPGLNKPLILDLFEDSFDYVDVFGGTHPYKEK